MEDNKLIEERKRKLHELQSKGINAYPYSYDKKDTVSDILERFRSLEKEQKTDEKVSVAGRIMFTRRMGKATFMHVQDQTGRIQFYFRQDDVGKEEYKLLKQLDIGDLIGAEGTVFTTKTGEISIYVESFEILCKSIRPLPEKFHGLKDEELKNRKRYLDFIMNPDTRKRFEMRTRIISLVRTFMNEKDFMEVETPVLQPIYGGTNAKPFTTHINAYDMQMYLRVAPELYLKRLLVGGYERIYEIARNFRNEGVDQTHHPEFTMIEWYEAYADYFRTMDLAEEMYKYIAKSLYGKEEVQVHDKTIDLSKRWPRMSLIESIRKFADIDVENLSDKELHEVLKKNKVEISGESSRGIMIFEIFDKLVCDKLVDPIWIIDYPKEVSPLAKQKRDDERFVERFECYIGGKEIGDGWSEINNPIDQRGRFENEQKAMRQGNEEAHPMDEDFIEAMEYGMPPTGGIGIGIDRLVMLFTNTWSIRDVIFFPFVRPRGEDHGE